MLTFKKELSRTSSHHAITSQNLLTKKIIE